MTTPRRRIRGFTMIETMVSAAVLTIIVFAAVTASHSAMRATSGVVSTDSADGRVRHALDRLRALFLSASAGTLSGVPLVGGAVTEPMQDALDYVDVNFRSVSGYANGGPIYVPPLAAAPMHLFRVVDASGRGSLMLDNGRTTTVLVSDVNSATFQRTGKRIEIDLVIATPDANGTASFQLELVLLVP